MGTLDFRNSTETGSIIYEYRWFIDTEFLLSFLYVLYVCTF